jgi:thiol-disulfide isomerase/thioredoxin
MNRSLLLAGVTLAALPTALSAQETILVDAVVKVADPSNREAPPPVAPLSETVNLSRTVPAGAAGVVEDGWFGTCTVGGKTVTIAVGKSDGGLDLPDLMCVDLDGDGKFSAAEKMVIEVRTQDSRGTTIVRAAPVEASFALSKAVLPVTAGFMRFGDREPSVGLQFPQYMEGRFDFGGSSWLVAIVDKDFDGTFGSAGDFWALGTPGGRPASAYGLSAIGERVFQAGNLIGISVDGSKIKVAASPAKGPDPKDAAAHRERVEHLWMERFDKEREGFVAQRGLDTARPLAKKPVEWRYVTYAEALELGQKAGKPVFIDVMAFWCVWCYRMDYYTYPDAEVAKMLNEDFVPVKVIQEQDLVGDYDLLMKQKLEAGGIPAMGVFRGDGTVIHKIGGWKKPQDFLTELRTAKAAFAGTD